MTPPKRSTRTTAAMYSESNATALAQLGEKVDSIANSVGKLHEIVSEDRRNTRESTTAIYSHLGEVRDRISATGKITWPIIVSTIGAMIVLSTLVAGIGGYALRSESSVLNSRIDALNDRLTSNSQVVEIQRQRFTEEMVKNAEAAARNEAWIEVLRQDGE